MRSGSWALTAELAEGQGGVGAAEAEGVVQRDLDVHLAGLIGDVVEIAVGIRRLVVDGRGQQAVMEAEDGGDRLHAAGGAEQRSEEHTSELQSLRHLVCRLLLEKK